MLRNSNGSETTCVLLIEDDPGDATLVRLLLQEDRADAFRIETASSLKLAQSLLETGGFVPDVVLLDLNLPDSTGSATVDRCWDLCSAPIVVLTGLDDLAVTELAIESGAEDYLAKGSSANELKRAILYAIVRHRREADARLLADVFTHAREGITVTDSQANILDVNEAFTRITGYSRDEVVGKSPRILKSDYHDKAFYQAMWLALESNRYWEGEVWNRRKNGEVFAEYLTISAICDNQGRTQHYVALFSDITAQKNQEKHLQRLAHYDALTDLPNRVLFSDRLHQSMARAKRNHSILAIAYIDLDGFKIVNDTHGHAIGDHLLIRVAKRMRLSVREGDTIARLGGDEFIALFPDLDDYEDCLNLIHRLLAAINDPMLLNEVDFRISASIGLSFYPQTEEIEADQLVRQADQAMYQAKLLGKNRFHLFDAEQEQTMRVRHEEREELRRGMESGELVLFYQPKVSMRDGEVIGVEALVRWQHPQRGLLLPEDFLPLMYHDSLATALDLWVLKSALDQLQYWQAMGLELSVSVNLSAETLHLSNFAEQLRDLLAKHADIPGDRLQLEILETSALEDMVRVSKLIRECSELGVSFALDDFGTGYSSLSYLKSLPAGQLKVDQSFVRDILNDPDDLAILEAVMGLASAFQRQVIAEGVETAAHGALLLNLGCELAQGYGIARPMPAGELPAWLDQWRPPASWASCPKLHPDDLSLLYAEVELRARIEGLKRHLLTGDAPPPISGAASKRFILWQEQFAGRDATQAGEIAERYQRLLDLAQALLKQRAEQGTAMEPQQLEELGTCSEQLLEQLSRFRCG